MLIFLCNKNVSKLIHQPQCYKDSVICFRLHVLNCYHVFIFLCVPKISLLKSIPCVWNVDKTVECRLLKVIMWTIQENGTEMAILLLMLLTDLDLDNLIVYFVHVNCSITQSCEQFFISMKAPIWLFSLCNWKPNINPNSKKQVFPQLSGRILSPKEKLIKQEDKTCSNLYRENTDSGHLCVSETLETNVTLLRAFHVSSIKGDAIFLLKKRSADMSQERNLEEKCSIFQPKPYFLYSLKFLIYTMCSFIFNIASKSQTFCLYRTNLKQ